ncbi:hypothetical protein HPG69_003276 [Diceros bicornis minor]|uniref:N-terminal Ras-GEF domain-containing protein n=1 Tax=Diceros bicornis minor TaxID=77932 RepID=A0A7J7E8J6_DICBM|nr:hypothetical protein HPG69_003276 [Diceros bicornis minor]
MLTPKAGTIEMALESLVFSDRNMSYIATFPCTYQAFTATQQVLDQLFHRRVLPPPQHSEPLNSPSEEDMRRGFHQFKVIEDIPLLQEAANQYNFEPKEQFGAWFQATEPLSEDKSHCLSCQLEPPFQWASKIQEFFKAKKSPPSSSSGLSECLDWQ